MELSKIGKRGLLLLALVWATLPAFSTTYTWTGKAPSPNNQDWFTPMNWMPTNGVPGAGDTAIIGSTATGYTINIASPVTVANLTLYASTLQGAGTLTVTGAMECQDMQLTILGGIYINGTANFDPVPSIPVYNTTTLSCPMTINGVANVNSNGVLMVYGNVTLTNNGTFNLNGGAQLNLGTAGAVFLNNNLFNVSGGTAVVETDNSVFNNSDDGAMHVTGLLQISGVFSDSGTIVVDLNGAVMDTARTAFHDGADFLGAGPFILSGQATLDGEVDMGGNLFLGSSNTLGNLALAGTLEIFGNGILSIYGGSLTGVSNNLTGTILVDTNANVIITNVGGFSLRNTVLTNNGTITWTDSGAFFVGYGAQIFNRNHFIATGDGSLNPLSSGSSNYNVAYFYNDKGTFQKTSSSTNANVSTYIAIPFYNGAVIVQSGNLFFNSGGNIGDWSVAAGTTIQIKGGSWLAGDPSNLTSAAISGVQNAGGGQVILSTGTLTMVDEVIPFYVSDAGTFTLSGGTLTGFGLMKVQSTGNFLWNSGTISIAGADAIDIAAGGIMSIAGGSAVKVISQTGIYNQGSILWTNANSAGYVAANDHVIIDNHGIFLITCDSYIIDGSTNTHPVITNEADGIFGKTLATGTSSIGIPFYNFGQVIAEEGTIDFSYFQDIASPYAIIELEGGKIIIDNAVIIHEKVTGNGSFTANKGATFSDDEVDILLIIFSGSITNDGTFVFYSGSIGSASLNGFSFSQTANGKMVIPIRGTNATNGDFGQFKVSNGGVNLAGTLQVVLTNGYAPPIGLSYAIISSIARNGSFTNVLLPPGLGLVYTNNNLNVVVTNATPVQILSPSAPGGQFQFGLNTVTNRSYTIQYKQKLTDPAWQFFTNFLGTGSFVPINVPPPLTNSAYFRVSEP